jgi:hypothetical protein
MPGLPAAVDELSLDQAFASKKKAAAPIQNLMSVATGPGTSPAAPADTNLNAVVAGGKTTPDQGTTQAPFRLGQAEAQAEQPYVSQLAQLLGPSGQSATSGLDEYLKNLPPQMAQTIQQGLGKEMSALSDIGPAIQGQAQQAGQAGELTNLLNAAKYQEIYKQALYGSPPPANTPIGQLYQQVVAGGNALTGSLPAVSPTGNPAPTATGAASTSSTPAASTPGVQSSTAPTGAPANPTIGQVYGTYVWNGQAWVNNG